MWAAAGVAAFLPAAAQHEVAAPEPVKVMVVGVFHMANPGHDIHNLQVDDVLTPARQREIEAITAGIGRFHPTAVMAEWPADLTRQRYAQYLAGTLAPSRNEVVQLGFRLAKEAGLKEVHGIDADGAFPYEPVQTYAAAHGQQALLDRMNARTQAQVDEEGRLLREEGIAATLRFLNAPETMQRSNAFYRDVLRVGAGDERPGVDLLTAWYRRNFLICSNLLAQTHPGDRVVVFYGSGHGLLLRQCVQETPGYELVEPNPFLPGK